MISEKVMTTQEVAERLSQLFKENKWSEAQDELYSEDAQSIEPSHAQGLNSVVGLDAIKKKGEDWNNMIEQFHGGYVSEPVIGGNHIAFSMGMEVTLKNAGMMKLDEIAVYEVKDGKVVKEQFFF